MTCVRAVASLNHPHICTLHDIGPGYMVMELIEGETLAAPKAYRATLPGGPAITHAVDCRGEYNLAWTCAHSCWER